jgi:hypothetical protein
MKGAITPGYVHNKCKATMMDNSIQVSRDRLMPLLAIISPKGLHEAVRHKHINAVDTVTLIMSEFNMEKPKYRPWDVYRSCHPKVIRLICELFHVQGLVIATPLQVCLQHGCHSLILPGNAQIIMHHTIQLHENDINDKVCLCTDDEIWEENRDSEEGYKIKEVWKSTRFPTTDNFIIQASTHPAHLPFLRALISKTILTHMANQEDYRSTRTVLILHMARNMTYEEIAKLLHAAQW